MNINNLEINELYSYYTVVNDICNELSKMTDNYTLINGQQDLADTPQEFRDTIQERQRFVGYKLKLKNTLMDKVTKLMEENDFNAEIIHPVVDEMYPEK